MDNSKIKAYCMKRDKAIIAAVRDGDLDPLRKLAQDQTVRTPSDDVSVRSTQDVPCRHNDAGRAEAEVGKVAG